MLKNILTSLVSLLVVFLILEAFFRFIEPKSPLGTTYGHRILRNSDGFRDREFEIPKPRNIKRIMVLGDSFTWGVGIDVNDTIPKILEKKLRITSMDFEVVNGAIPGDNTVRQLNRFKEKGLKYEPDMLLLIYNLNDIDFVPELAKIDYKDKKAIPDFQIEKGRNYKKYSKKHGVRGIIYMLERKSKFIAFLVPRVGEILRRLGLIDSIEFSWVEKIFAGYTDESPGWLESKRALKELKDICEQNNIKFIMAIYPLLKELDNYQGNEAHITIKNYGHKLGIEVIDLLPIFKGDNGSRFWINHADSHPNEEAHGLVTDYLIKSIEKF